MTEQTCFYNRHVLCDERMCAKCGWHPEVDAKRREELRGIYGERKD